MAVVAKMYGNCPANAFTGKLHDLGSEETDIRVMLLTNEYTPDQVNDKVIGDVSEFEVVGQNYEAGGKSLTNKTLTHANNVTTFNADEVYWDNSTLSVKYAVLYDNTSPVPEEKTLISFVDFNEVVSSFDGTFKIVWNAGGIFTITVA